MMSKTALPKGIKHNGVWKTSMRPIVVYQEKMMLDKVQKCVRLSLFSQQLNWGLMRDILCTDAHLESSRWENLQLGNTCVCILVSVPYWLPS